MLVHLAALLIEDREKHLKIAYLGTVVDSNHHTEEDGQILKNGGSRAPLANTFFVFAIAFEIKAQVHHLKNEISQRKHIEYWQFPSLLVPFLSYDVGAQIMCS